MATELGKLTIKHKIEKRPGGTEYSLHRYVLDEPTLKGGEQWDHWIFGAKFNGVKYAKIYIDPDAKLLLGKKDELSPWIQLGTFSVVERVHL